MRQWVAVKLREVTDSSLKEASPERQWKEKARRAIRRSDLVLVVLGQNTFRAPGVLAEVALAREEGKPFVRLIGRRNTPYRRLPAGGKAIAWTWPNLNALFAWSVEQHKWRKMAFRISDLEAASRRVTASQQHRTLNEARAAGRRTAFLSHSHLDRGRALGLQRLLAEAGWDLFIDWEHNTLDERPTKETAAWLQLSIEICDWTLYLATPNSERSRWCPWEIGYADGKKGAKTIAVIATTDSGGTYGSEYLELYRQISPTDIGKVAMFEAGKTTGGRLLSEASTFRP